MPSLAPKEEVFVWLGRQRESCLKNKRNERLLNFCHVISQCWFEKNNLKWINVIGMSAKQSYTVEQIVVGPATYSPSMVDSGSAIPQAELPLASHQIFLSLIYRQVLFFVF